MPDRPLKYRELRQLLAAFGIGENVSRGKGSHRMFSGVVDGQERRYPVPCHNEGDELAKQYVKAVRRAFGLSSTDGVSDEQFYQD
jgi:predicted RNA binding protein YcfA (HicA-like mRNA interferase family)